MNIIYLHVVTGKQAGSFIELVAGNHYVISNNYESADVYLDTDADFSIDLSVSDKQCVFNKCVGNIALKTGLIELKQSYTLPLSLNIDDVWVVFSLNEEISTAQIEELTLASGEDLRYLLENESDGSNLEYSAPNIDISTDDEKIDDFNSQITMQHKLKMSAMKSWDKLKHYSSIAWTKIVYYWSLFRQKFGIWSYVIAGVVLLIFLIFIIAIYQYRAQNTNSNAQLKNVYVEQLIKEKLAKLPKKYSDLKSSRSENKFLISGITTEAVNLEELRSYFQPWLSQIKFQVLDFNTIKKNVLKIMADNQIMQPNVVYDQALSTVSILGIIGNNKNLDDIVIAISNQYPMLGDMDTSKMYLSSDLDTQIDNLVKSKTEQINVDKNYDKGIVTLNGYLTNDDQIQIESKVKIFNKMHAGVVQINTNFQNILKALSFGINEVYTGNPAWLTTDDGVKLYVGGTYKGITLVAIDKEKITFKGKSAFIVMLNQLLSNDLGGGNQVSVNNNCCDRDSVLKQEYVKKVQVINDETRQLKDLQKILATTKDAELKKSLMNTINNLKQDLEFRKKELAYYQGGNN